MASSIITRRPLCLAAIALAAVAPVSTRAAISLQVGQEVSFDFNTYHPQTDPFEPDFRPEYSIPQTSMSTSGAISAYRTDSRGGGFNDEAGSPWSTLTSYTDFSRLNDYIINGGPVENLNGYGVNATNDRSDGNNFIWFKATISPVVLRFQFINTGTEPITGLQISYEAQNLTVAYGGAFIGSDIRGFENVGLHFFIPYYTNLDYSSPLNLIETQGVRKLVEEFLPMRGNANPLGFIYPNQTMTMYIFQDRNRYAERENAYLFDNLRIFAVPEPSTVFFLIPLVVSITLRRRS